MKRQIKYTVPVERDGVLLRDILRRELLISATLLRRMKGNPEAILKNGHPAFVTVPVSAGDEISLVLEEDQVNTRVVPTRGKVEIVFENQDLIIVNKPADLTVHPTSGHYDDSLANILVGMYGENFIFRPINRLDRGTSGLMAVAKNAYTHTFLVKKGIVREYLAICEGVPSKPCGTIDAPIGREDDSLLKREIRPDGREAVTHYKVLESRGGRSLVRLKLETGRTHQIRVHMASIGCPLTGDFLYGEEIEGFNRVALHSAYLKCTLPFVNEELKIESELPKELKDLIYLA